MKRVLSLALACLLLLCSCAVKGKYLSAREKTLAQSRFTAEVESVMKVEYGTAAEQAETEGWPTEYREKVRYAQDGSIVLAARESADGHSDYYYTGGTVYNVSEFGSYSWQADNTAFFSEFCYAKPMELDIENGEKKDGTTVYTATFDGNAHRKHLLSINPAYDDFTLDSAHFTRFVYTATVKDGMLESYTYDLAFDAFKGQSSVKITNVITVTYLDEPMEVTLPEGYESFEVTEGNILDISEEAFTREVMLIILEQLYNPDGTRRDDFDENYAEFVEMYGEETMATFVGGIEQYNQSIGLE